MTTLNAKGLQGSVVAEVNAGAISNSQGTFFPIGAQDYASSFPQDAVLLTVNSVVVGAGEKVLCTYVWDSSSSNNNQTGAQTHSLRRDGGQITSWASGNYSGAGTKLFVQYIDNPGVGTYSYTMFYPTGGEATYRQAYLKINVISSDDTHSAPKGGSFKN